VCLISAQTATKASQTPSKKCTVTSVGRIFITYAIPVRIPIAIEETYDVVMKEEIVTAMVPVGDECYHLSAKVHSRETITSLQSFRKYLAARL